MGMQKGSVAANVDDYIAAAPVEARERLNQMREIVRRRAPEATESISYQMPGYKLHGQPLVYFAAFKNHLGLYAANGTTVAANPELLEGYETSKGTIRLPLDKPLPVELIEKLVKIRLEENEAGARANARVRSAVRSD